MGIYCIVDDILKQMNHKEHSNRTVFDSQMLTTAIVSTETLNLDIGNLSSVIEYLA